MIGITTIEVLKPDLYKWIACNKEAVCGSLTHGLYNRNYKPEELRKKYVEEFTELGLDPNKSIKSVAALFPVFAHDTKEDFYDGYNPENVRGKMRAAQEDRFELYFAFNLESIKVSRKTINDCIYDLEKDDLKSVIIEINIHSNIIPFLNEIQANLDVIPYNRLSILSSALLEIGDLLNGETEQNMFSISASYFAGICVEQMLNRIKTQGERFDIYKGVLSQCDIYSLGTLAQEINRIEIAYGRLAAGKSENISEQIISLQQLEELEKLFVERIKVLINNENLMDAESFSMIIYLWECFDEESVRKYIDKIFVNDINKLKFISRFATKWRGTGGGGWFYNSKHYSKYITDEEIYNLIKKYDKSQMNIFSELEQIKLASFVLNYKKDEMHHVSEQKAKELVDEWRRA